MRAPVSPGVCTHTERGVGCVIDRPDTKRAWRERRYFDAMKISLARHIMI